MQSPAPATSNAPRGVLLVNLGTPDAPTPRAVRRYLREFLSDPRVVEVPRLVWWPLLNGVILPLRASRSAALYAKVWTDEGSPLLVHGRAARTALAERLGAGYQVTLGMRYGRPGLAGGLEELRQAGCRAIRVLPLFPQYSNTTTGSVQAEVARLLSRLRDAPAYGFVAPYFDEPAYVEAVALRAEEARGEREIDEHVFSFHGLPEAYVEKGDPYRAQCEATAEALAARLELERGRWRIAFQSRFGRAPWLQPYTDEVLAELATRRARAQIVLPGFAADCLETLEEIGIGLAHAFVEAGGRELVVTPALNASPAWIECLAELAERRWS